MTSKLPSSSTRRNFFLRLLNQKSYFTSPSKPARSNSLPPYVAPQHRDYYKNVNSYHGKDGEEKWERLRDNKRAEKFQREVNGLASRYWAHLPRLKADKSFKNWKGEFNKYWAQVSPRQLKDEAKEKNNTEALPNKPNSASKGEVVNAPRKKRKRRTTSRSSKPPPSPSTKRKSPKPFRKRKQRNEYDRRRSISEPILPNYLNKLLEEARMTGPKRGRSVSVMQSTLRRKENSRNDRGLMSSIGYYDNYLLPMEIRSDTILAMKRNRRRKLFRKKKRPTSVKSDLCFSPKFTTPRDYELTVTTVSQKKTNNKSVLNDDENNSLTKSMANTKIASQYSNNKITKLNKRKIKKKTNDQPSVCYDEKQDNDDSIHDDHLLEQSRLCPIEKKTTKTGILGDYYGHRLSSSNTEDNETASNEHQRRSDTGDEASESETLSSNELSELHHSLQPQHYYRQKRDDSEEEFPSERIGHYIDNPCLSHNRHSPCNNRFVHKESKSVPNMNMSIKWVKDTGSQTETIQLPSHRKLLQQQKHLPEKEQQPRSILKTMLNESNQEHKKISNSARKIKVFDDKNVDVKKSMPVEESNDKKVDVTVKKTELEEPDNKKVDDTVKRTRVEVPCDKKVVDDTVKKPRQEEPDDKKVGNTVRKTKLEVPDDRKVGNNVKMTRIEEPGEKSHKKVDDTVKKTKLEELDDKKVDDNVKKTKIEEPKDKKMNVTVKRIRSAGPDDKKSFGDSVKRVVKKQNVTKKLPDNKKQTETKTPENKTTSEQAIKNSADGDHGFSDNVLRYIANSLVKSGISAADISPGMPISIEKTDELEVNSKIEKKKLQEKKEVPKETKEECKEKSRKIVKHGKLKPNSNLLENLKESKEPTVKELNKRLKQKQVLMTEMKNFTAAMEKQENKLKHKSTELKQLKNGPIKELKEVTTKNEENKVIKQKQVTETSKIGEENRETGIRNEGSKKPKPKSVFSQTDKQTIKTQELKEITRKPEENTKTILSTKAEGPKNVNARNEDGKKLKTEGSKDVSPKNEDGKKSKLKSEFYQQNSSTSRQENKESNTKSGENKKPKSGTSQTENAHNKVQESKEIAVKNEEAKKSKQKPETLQVKHSPRESGTKSDKSKNRDQNQHK